MLVKGSPVRPKAVQVCPSSSSFKRNWLSYIRWLRPIASNSWTAKFVMMGSGVRVPSAAPPTLRPESRSSSGLSAGRQSFRRNDESRQDFCFVPSAASLSNTMKPDDICGYPVYQGHAVSGLSDLVQPCPMRYPQVPLATTPREHLHRTVTLGLRNCARGNRPRPPNWPADSHILFLTVA